MQYYVGSLKPAAAAHTAITREASAHAGQVGAGRGSRIMSPDLQSLVVAAAMAIGAGVAVTLVLLVAVAVLLLWLFELSVTVCSSLTE